MRIHARGTHPRTLAVLLRRYKRRQSLLRLIICARLEMGKTRKNFYAVRVGREVGVYKNWEECLAQVTRYPGAVYKGFSSASEAESYVGASGSSHARSTYGNSRRSYHHNSRPSYRQQQYSEPVSSYSYQSSSSSSAWDDYSSYSDQSSVGSAQTYHAPSHSRSRDSEPGTSRGVSRPTVYSDGCCFNNGRPCASAGIGVFWGDSNPHNVSEKLIGTQTNQRAELVAARRAIQSAIDQGHSAVEVKTDSSYTIKAMTEWLGKWKRNGWQTSNAGPVKKKEDIVQLEQACQKIDVKWTHVPGHRGVAGNEAADELAKAGSFKR